MAESLQIEREKQRLRQRLRTLRRDQTDKEQLSRQAFAHLLEWPPFSQAGTVLFYIDVRDELRTQASVREVLQTTVKVVVPYCEGDLLRLVEIQDFAELIPGTYGILEPAIELRQSATRLVLPTEIDLALIPGLGFDRRGARIGFGKGYYDRLLAQFREDCPRVALAFDCQLVDFIPMTPHDQFVDFIVTESGIHECDRNDPSL